MTGRIALVVGHNSKARGAVRITDGVTEYEWNGLLAREIAVLNPARYRIFRRYPGLGYAAEISRVYQEVDDWGASASIELHFNAGRGGATGTETLTSGTPKSLRLASLLQSSMVVSLELRNRGLVKRGRHERGGLSLWAGRAPAALIEPYFGSNSKDCAAADMIQLARAIDRAATEFLAREARDV